MARIFFGDKKNYTAPSKLLPYATGQLFHPAPNGTHNPNIDAEVGVHGAELNDYLEGLTEKAGITKRNLAQNSRNLTNEEQRSIAGNNRQLGYDQDTENYNLGQLGINFSRSIEDLSTAKIRGQQDYDRTLTNMQHEYGSKAEQQSQNAIQQGTDEAGTNTASAAVRGANQAFDKGNVDLSHARNEEDLAQQQTRDTENFGTQKAHIEEGFGHQQEATGIQNQETATKGSQARNTNTRSLGELLHQNAVNANINQRKQGEYETNAGRSSYYEANQLHPGLQFPGGTHPNSPTTGPHLYGSASGPGLYGGVKAPSPVKYGTNVGGGKRLAAPRY